MMKPFADFVRVAMASFVLFVGTISASASAQDREQFQMIEGDGGVPLRVVDAGNPDGPVILFIHGLSQSTLSFDRQFNSDLADRYRLVAFDLRGHAGSAKPWQLSDYSGSRVWAADVAAVMEALDLQDVTIVAWSFGGFVAVSYLRHFGDDRVRGLNLVGTAAGLVDIQPPPNNRIQEARANSMLRASLDLAVGIEAFKSLPDGLTAEPMEAEDRDISYYTGLMLPGYVMRAFGGLPLNNRDMPERLTVPALLSIGTEDIGMDVASAQRLHGALPGSTLSLYEGDGHFPAYESTERFNRELATFVDGSAPELSRDKACASE